MFTVQGDLGYMVLCFPFLYCGNGPFWPYEFPSWSHDLPFLLDATRSPVSWPLSIVIWNEFALLNSGSVVYFLNVMFRLGLIQILPAAFSKLKAFAWQMEVGTNHYVMLYKMQSLPLQLLVIRHRARYKILLPFLMLYFQARIPNW